MQEFASQNVGNPGDLSGNFTEMEKSCSQVSGLTMSLCDQKVTDNQQKGSLGNLLPGLLGFVSLLFLASCAFLSSSNESSQIKETDFQSFVDDPVEMGTPGKAILPTKTYFPTRTETIAPTETEIPTDTPTPFVTVTQEPGILSSMVSDVDGMTLMYVPEGEFIMGSIWSDIDYAVELCGEVSNLEAANCKRNRFTDEQPEKKVFLDAYWFDQTEVTNAMYANCVADGGCDKPEFRDSYTRGSYYNNEKFADFPVIYVTWQNAADYCAWAGRRLPSEAEWEKAARGDTGQTFPWGDSFNGNTLNFCDTNCDFDWKHNGFDDGYRDTAPVGNYLSGVSPFGALDMAGNVWEWTADWYDENYYQISPETNPEGPLTGALRVIRGGSWGNIPSNVRSAERSKFKPMDTWSMIGFRCVLSE